VPRATCVSKHPPHQVAHTARQINSPSSTPVQHHCTIFVGFTAILDPYLPSAIPLITVILLRNLTTCPPLQILGAIAFYHVSNSLRTAPSRIKEGTNERNACSTTWRPKRSAIQITSLSPVVYPHLLIQPAVAPKRITNGDVGASCSSQCCSHIFSIVNFSLSFMTGLTLLMSPILHLFDISFSHFYEAVV